MPTPIEPDSCPTTHFTGSSGDLVLVDLQQGTRLSVSAPKIGESIFIGRDAETDLVLTDPKASRLHCKLVRQGSQWRVEDLGSSNGTFLNGEKIKHANLIPGDILQAGSQRFRIDDALDTTDPQATRNLLIRMLNKIQPFRNQKEAA